MQIAWQQGPYQVIVGFVPLQQGAAFAMLLERRAGTDSVLKHLFGGPPRSLWDEVRGWLGL